MRDKVGRPLNFAILLLIDGWKKIITNAKAEIIFQLI